MAVLASYPPSGSAQPGEIRLRLFDIGTDAKPARLQSTNIGPFNLSDADTFRLLVQNGPDLIDRTVTVHLEHFQDITQATAVELARLFESELPGVTVTMADDGTFAITSSATGATAILTVPPSPVTAKIGALVVTPGTDAVGAQLNGARDQPFLLVDHDSLLLTVDGQSSTRIVFETSGFVNINAATAAEVATAINRVLPGVAQVNGLRLDPQVTCQRRTSVHFHRCEWLERRRETWLWRGVAWQRAPRGGQRTGRDDGQSKSDLVVLEFAAEWVLEDLV